MGYTAAIVHCSTRRRNRRPELLPWASRWEWLLDSRLGLCKAGSVWNVPSKYWYNKLATGLAKKRERFAQQRFLPTEDAPFRCETSWRWQDDHCNVTLITLEGLCRLMMEMQISRIQVIGDSMSSTFSSSFLSLIGNGNLTVDFWDKELSVVCPEGVPNLKFLHTRRNKIDTVHDLPSGFVTSNINRTAIILNFGAHMKTLEEFQGNVSTAFQWLDSLNRTNNYVVFRDLSPGHANCSRTFPPTRWKTSLPPLKEIPFHNYSEWLQSGVSDVINWMSFDSFNAHVKQMLASRMTQQPDKQKVIYLNIFNSTLLRRDGHVWRNDCLHYAIPGPVDWWVHFWYSASMEVLQIARKTQGSNVHLWWWKDFPKMNHSVWL